MISPDLISFQFKRFFSMLMVAFFTIWSNPGTCCNADSNVTIWVIFSVRSSSCSWAFLSVCNCSSTEAQLAIPPETSHTRHRTSCPWDSPCNRWGTQVSCVVHPLPLLWESPEHPGAWARYTRWWPSYFPASIQTLHWAFPCQLPWTC